MKRRYLDPHDPEVHQAVLERIRRMTREERLRSVEELSHAPEGVEDPWPPYEEVAPDGSEPAPTDAIRASSNTAPFVPVSSKGR